MSEPALNPVHLACGGSLPSSSDELTSNNFQLPDVVGGVDGGVALPDVAGADGGQARGDGMPDVFSPGALHVGMADNLGESSIPPWLEQVMLD